MKHTTCCPMVTAFLLAGTAACSPDVRSAAFVETLGTDTMSVEVFSRTADRLEGRLITRTPVTRIATYAATLSPRGAMDRLEVDVVTPAENPDGPGPTRIVMSRRGDSVVVERYRQEADTIMVSAPEGTLFFVAKAPMPIAFAELAVRQAGRADTPFAITTLPAGGQRTSANTLTRVAGDTVALDFFGMPMYLMVDQDGLVTGLDGHATTLKVSVAAADPATIDVDALGADFATRDARGAGIGVASPRETVQASGGGADFEVDYSRPAARGREIWGGLVSPNVVWRTGANAATVFTTSRDLMVGDARVPAGSYTLWSMYADGDLTLIINAQTGQWGTAYDSAQDLVHVPMTAETLDEPFERFTIAVDPMANGGMLRFSWDRTVFAVPMRVVR
ncbi:MAG TPA: DUF2911 domain-containing protein [Gemmatimonadales bacterium]